MKNLLKNMRKIFSNKKSKSAYSLIELSIVILIISILITGALSVSVSSINNAKIKTTNDRMKELYKALGNYLVINKKLPCPASLIHVKSSNANYGAAATDDGICATIPGGGGGVYTSGTVTNLVYGMVPVKALNLSSDMAEDGFENKIIYIVDKRLTQVATTNAVGGFNNGFVQGVSNPTPIITITENPSGNSNTFDLVLMSLGANKAGGYNSNGSSQTVRSSDVHEQSNDNGTGTNFDASLVSASGNSDVFDDIIFAKKRIEMMTEFNAYSAIPCLTYSETLYGVTVTWPIGTYDQAVVSSTACPGPTYNHGATNPVRRCGAFGQWGAILNACT